MWTGPLDFVDIGAAQSFPAAMQELDARAGEPITLEGFVTQDASAPPDEILLTRYIVTCCVADATVAQVRIVGLPPGSYPSDEWLQVTGAVYPVGREVLVAANTVQQIPRAFAALPHAVAAQSAHRPTRSSRCCTRANPARLAELSGSSVRSSVVSRSAGTSTSRIVPQLHTPGDGGGRELVRELVASVLLVGGHPPHDARLFERGEVAVRGALLHVARRLESAGSTAGSRRRPAAAREVAPLSGVALAGAAQARLHRRVELGAHAAPLTAAGSDRRARLTTVNTAAATNTMEPLMDRWNTCPMTTPTNALAAPTTAATITVCRNERASSCAIATGNTMSAAISNSPTTFIPATMTAAVSAASATPSVSTGRPSTRAHPSSDTTANSTRRSDQIPTATTPPTTSTAARPALDICRGSPNRYGKVSRSRSPAFAANATPSADPRVEEQRLCHQSIRQRPLGSNQLQKIKRAV